MKLICTLFGVALLIVAVVYFVMPADQLPSFFPDHEGGLMRPHVKHVVAAVAGVVLLAIGWIMGGGLSAARISALTRLGSRAGRHGA